ncbi:MAG TPA: HD domain-containing phosphohydrolase [Acidobacteriota bacterium]|nr:HD domain-containing phosphohydrolase [Acidobacteriota bacterium]
MGMMTLRESRPQSLNQTERILVVDDEPLVRDLLSSYLRSAGYPCQTASSGREALDKLEEQPASLVIADIRMPELNGLQLLDSLVDEHPDTAAIMITAVADMETAVGTMKQGAYDYITKPFNLEKVAGAVSSALEKRRRNLEERRLSMRLEQLVDEKTSLLSDAMLDLKDHHEMTLDVLMKVLDARGHETQRHSQRVRAYTLRLADEMNFPSDQRVALGRGALLHDIGKVGIPDSILLKPGRLTPDEWERMKEHTTIGYKILKGVRFLDSVAEMVLSHHERWDGKGYPRGLKGEHVPLEARMFAILDAFDAMTSNRPYRDALSVEYACREISANAGKQFDPEVVKPFLCVPVEDWMEIGAEYRERI